MFVCCFSLDTHFLVHCICFSLAFLKCLLISVRIPVSYYQRPTSLLPPPPPISLSCNVCCKVISVCGSVCYVCYVYMCRSIFITPQRYQYTEINLYKANNRTVYTINLSEMILQVHLHCGYRYFFSPFSDTRRKNMGLLWYSGLYTLEWRQTILISLL